MKNTRAYGMNQVNNLVLHICLYAQPHDSQHSSPSPSRFKDVTTNYHRHRHFLILIFGVRLLDYMRTANQNRNQAQKV